MNWTSLKSMTAGARRNVKTEQLRAAFKLIFYVWKRNENTAGEVCVWTVNEVVLCLWFKPSSCDALRDRVAHKKDFLKRRRPQRLEKNIDNFFFTRRLERVSQDGVSLNSVSIFNMRRMFSFFSWSHKVTSLLYSDKAGSSEINTFSCMLDIGYLMSIEV